MTYSFSEDRIASCGGSYVLNGGPWLPPPLHHGSVTDVPSVLPCTHYGRSPKVADQIPSSVALTPLLDSRNDHSFFLAPERAYKTDPETLQHLGYHCGVLFKKREEFKGDVSHKYIQQSRLKHYLVSSPPVGRWQVFTCPDYHGRN